MCPPKALSKNANEHTKIPSGSNPEVSSPFCPSLCWGQDEIQIIPGISILCNKGLFELGPFRLEVPSGWILPQIQVTLLSSIDDKSLNTMWTSQPQKEVLMHLKQSRNLRGQMARIQHGATIKRWRIDQGGGVYQLRSHGYPKGFRYCDWTIRTSSTSTKWEGPKRAIRLSWKKVQCLRFTACLAAIMVGILR